MQPLSTKCIFLNYFYCKNISAPFKTKVLRGEYSLSDTNCNLYLPISIVLNCFYCPNISTSSKTQVWRGEYSLSHTTYNLYLPSSISLNYLYCPNISTPSKTQVWRGEYSVHSHYLLQQSVLILPSNLNLHATTFNKDLQGFSFFCSDVICKNFADF